MKRAGELQYFIAKQYRSEKRLLNKSGVIVQSHGQSPLSIDAARHTSKAIINRHNAKEHEQIIRPLLHNTGQIVLLFLVKIEITIPAREKIGPTNITCV